MTVPQLRLTIRRGPDSTPHCISFDDQRVTIGRSVRCDIRLPYRVASSHHLTIERRGSGYVARDEHSTNGTALDGSLLEPGQWQPLEDRTTLQIVDVYIDIEMLDESPVSDLDGFTLAQTGTLARELLGEALAEEESDLAYFELLDGPTAGRRYRLPDDARDVVIGGGDAALVNLPSGDVPDELATVNFRNDAFWLEPNGDGSLRLAGNPLETETRLSDGDELSAAGHRLVFCDPLESQLDELAELDRLESGLSEKKGSNVEVAENGVGENPAPDKSAESENERPGETPGRSGPRRRGWAEAVLLVSTALLVVAVIVILLVTFGIV